MEQTGKKSKEMDMLNGGLAGKLILFSIPLAFSSILQQLFNSADVAVVGRFAGDQALAAVGSCVALVGIFVNLIVGLAVGPNAALANLIGQKNRGKINSMVHTILTFGAVLGIALLVIGMLVARRILVASGTPETVLDQALLYIRIYFVGIPFMVAYNFGSAIVRSYGDTRRPMCYLIVSGVLNVILNLLLVIGFHLGVAGVAIATVISNAVSSLLLLYCLTHTDMTIRVSAHALHFDRASFAKIVQIGLPAGIQSAVFAFANIIVQAAINSLGAEVMAASAAAFNLEILVYYIMNSFGQACTTFTGQNYGAGLLSRCRRVGKICTLQNLAATVASSMIVLAAGPYLLSVFSSDPEVIALGMIRLEFILIPEPLNMISEAVSGFLRAFGKSLAPAMAALVGICGTRILYVFTIFPTHQTFTWLMAVYPLSWLVAAAGILFVLYYYRKLYMGPDRV